MYYILKLCKECYKKLINGELELPPSNNYIITEWDDANFTCDLTLGSVYSAGFIDDLPIVNLDNEPQDEVPSFFKVYSGAFDDFFGAISQRFSDASVTIERGNLNIQFPYCCMTTRDERWVDLYQQSSTYQARGLRV